MGLRLAEVSAIDRSLSTIGPYLKRNLVPLQSIKPTAQPPGTLWSAIAYNPSSLAGDWNYNAIAVHHSGNAGAKDPVQILNKHLNNGFDDVGYHYMIHPNGTIFEGRRISCKGSHVSAANTGKIGVVMLGDFDHQIWDFDDTLTSSHIIKLTSVIRILRKAFPNIDTLGGHKEFLPGRGYSCPGGELEHNPIILDHTLLL